MKVKLIAKSKNSKRTYSCFHNYLPNSRTLRKYPLLSALHRGVDGALVGVIFSGAFMTAFALHSQHLWTLNFSRLQITRDLSHRLEESTAVLERYFLTSASYPKSMVIAKSSDLVYLDRPKGLEKTPVKDFINNVKERLSSLSYPIADGY